MSSMKIKGIRSLALLICLMLVLSGCSIGNSMGSTLSQQSFSGNSGYTSSIGDLIAVSDTGEFTTTYKYKAEDLDDSWDKNNVTTVTFNGKTAQISGYGANFSNGNLIIEQGGTYVLSGTLANGQILIYTINKDLVRLVLDGLSIQNETGPAIYAPRCKKLVLILAEGTQNVVSDGSRYTSVGEDEPDAAIYVQDDLSITGSGALTVTGSYKHGIRTQDDLVITGGLIHVSAVEDALRGRDGVAIQEGTITLEAGNDGIKSNNDNKDTEGFVIINGGTFLIRAERDGIQAESSLTITDGSFDITCGGGSANAPARSSDFGGGRGWDGGWGGAPGSNSSTATDEDSESKKALKGGKQVYITGGEFIIDAEDDGIHSNENVFIASGSFSIKTGDDGIHADNAVVISDGIIDIPVCYEGIEGLSVTISGGDIDINASDDGINASQGEGKALNGGRIASGANQNAYVRITGGTVHIQGGTDGIDSNGHVYIEGGKVFISAQSQVMEGAIDIDGNFIITGGEIITAGSWDAAPSESTQPVILMSYTQTLAAGAKIAIKDSEGNVILEYTSKVAFSMSGFTSSSFIIGETYSLYIDDVERTDITLDTLVTRLSDSGGAYSGGQGGPGGGWGGGPSGGGNPGGGGPGGAGPGGGRGNW